MEGLNSRAKLGLRFIADMKAVSYLHFAQYLAPNYEPSTEPSPAAYEEEQPGYTLVEKRHITQHGGSRRNAPWPTSRRLRLKAVSRLVHRWEDMHLVRTERPWSDQPKWVYATQLGLHRLGLTY